MSATDTTKWLRAAIAVAVTAISATAVFSYRRKLNGLNSKLGELEISLRASIEKCGAERKGRIRAQQALRKALAQKSDKSEPTSYPMTPIAIVQSCFSTRNGTPRQPSLVPLARACLVLDPSRVPLEALEGLTEYSHIWILYVFHLNTNLEKLWKHPAKPKFKAKVKVPKLKGGKIGVLATRSPHRPCPIGLTVAKVEAVNGGVILLSGVDLVDGTPVLDIKPYLPYSDSIQGAMVPKWVTADSSLTIASIKFSPDFSFTLTSCWETIEKWSIYSSPDEFQSLIKQVLSWDIRSLSQRNRPHPVHLRKKSQVEAGGTVLESDSDGNSESEVFGGSGEFLCPLTGDVMYHLILEGVDVSYRIDSTGNVSVEKASVFSEIKINCVNRCTYTMWREKLGRQLT